MITSDEHLMPAALRECVRVAADVERWPEILPHYRWVRFHDKRAFATGRVEMAAWRDFAGPLRYPTWWVSDMSFDEQAPAILYRHIDGITRGMRVRWEFEPVGEATRVRVVHQWDGPPWPLVGRAAADLVIGPRFVSAIARRTLAGVADEAARSAPRSRSSADA